ncbi:MAG: type 4a pilus biogenesis protein PilO [Deltaproteobacteria bacterium]
MIPLKINLESVMKLPLQKRVLILAGVNVIIIALIFWLLVLPKHEESANLKVRLADLTIRLNESRAIASDIPKFLREKEDMENMLKAAVAQLPNDKEIPDLIESISRAGVKSGLKVLLFRPSAEVPKGFYAEVPVTMSVEGRFESLYEFSAKVGEMPRIVNIAGMDINSTGHKNRVPMLKANFVATTFRFIPTPAPEEETRK